MAIDPSKPFDLNHRVDEDQNGMRLDRYVCHKVPTISRTRVQQYVREDRVLVNETPRSQNWRVRTGDLVTLKCTVPEGGAEVARTIPLEVIYEDEHLVAFNKQPGLVVHPVALHRHDTLLNAVYYRYEDSIGKDQEISLANRIDKMTSGVILVTKDVPTKRSLQEQFEARSVSKSYLAMVYGSVSPAEQVIDRPIGPAQNRRNRTLMGIREDAEGKPSLSQVAVLERFPPSAERSAKDEGISLVRVEPKTGRQHQIRVHMAAIGHPLVADHLYGGNRGFRWRCEDGTVKEMTRFALHAERLTVLHPSTQEPLILTAPMPQDMCTLLAALRNGLALESFPLENEFAVEKRECGEKEPRFSHIPIGEHEYDRL